MKTIIPHLWFADNAEEAVDFYTSLFPNSRVTGRMLCGESAANVTGLPEGSVLAIYFDLNGQPFVAFNAGTAVTFNDAVSFMVLCESQDEMDGYYEKLSADREAEMCGWVKDKYGLSWQLGSDEIETLVRTGEPQKVERMFAAMITMKRLDIAALKRAYAGI
ncbi:MAG: VOC family protein [Fimbriimonadia bacterium]